MAHAQKIKKSGIVGLAIHCERREGCELSNQDIDKSCTHLNYNLAQMLQPLKPEEYVTKRVSEVIHLKRNDVVHMVDWIVTLPKDVKEEDQERFFEYTYEFLKEKYGSQNVVSAWIHNDEATPHIHFSFVPIVTIDGKERLKCKDIITKASLKQFHPALGAYLNERLGYMPSVQNEATINGNRTIKELKNQEDLSIKKSLKNIRENIVVSKEIVEKANDVDFEPSKLLDKTKTLMKCNALIDELKYSSQKLQSDNITLSQMVITQKDEINQYRSMPLAKQLVQKDEQIHNLYSSIDQLEKQVQDSDYDYHRLKSENIRLENKQEKTENELFVHKTFISMLGLDDVFIKFKRKLDKNEYSIDIHDLKGLCKRAIDKISEMFENLKERIHYLDQNQVSSEDITVKNHDRHYHDIEL